LTPSPSHPLHVTYGRLAIETKGITLKIRMFKDDLEKALAQSSRQPKVTVRSAPGIDSLFVAYLGERIKLVADGAELEGRIAGSGTTEQDMCWYLVQFATT